MKNLFFAILLFAFATQSIQGQDRLLTMEEAVIGYRSTLRPESLKQTAWIPATSLLAYISKDGDVETLHIANAKTAVIADALTLSKMNAVLKEQGLEELTVFPQITWKNENEFEYEKKGIIYLFNIKDMKVAEKGSNALDPQAANVDVDPVSGATAYTIDNNLYILRNEQVIQVTNDGTIGVVNGQAVHRFEFGIFKGTFWSNGGSQLAFYRKDETMVNDYPVIDWSSMPAANKNVKYPMAGGKSHHVTLGIYNLNSGNTVFVKTGEPAEQYLTNIAWSPDDKHIYIVVLNRDQNHFKMNRYSASTGEFEKTLFEETHDKYVQPLHKMEFVKGKSDHFIWQSRRDDYNHLYLCNTDGKLLKQLTSGPWEVTDFVGFDEKGKTVFYKAGVESPINSDLYSVTMSGKSKRLTSGDGSHFPIFNDNGEYFVDIFSSTTVPRKTDLYRSDGTMVKALHNADNPLKEYALADVSISTIKAEDGTDLYYRMYKPHNFDSTEKYPVIVYVYGGPGVQMIRNTWLAGGYLWFHLMAQKGYIIFTLENRGTPNRGRNFEQSTFRELGTIEMQDQLKGVEFLKNQPFVDSSRIGVHGWSYGGYMTTTLMTRSPGIFKVGVAGGPVIDWRLYEVMYTERFMDTPDVNESGYTTTDLKNYVKDLQGRLLVIHGADDDVVVWQHSISYIKKSVDEGVQVDYFVYPGHPHNVNGKDRVHLMEKITRYFEDFL